MHGHSGLFILTEGYSEDANSRACTRKRFAAGDGRGVGKRARGRNMGGG